MPSPRPRELPINHLDGFARRVLEAVGLPERHAATVAAQLVGADASGRPSHGVRSLPDYIGAVRAGAIDPLAQVATVTDSGAIVVLDGGGGFGQVTGAAASAIAVERARAHGIACVLGRNAGHLGRLGSYTEELAENGVAGILLANGQGRGQTIAPWGGREARFANNPISLGFPGEPFPAVVDVALSAAAGRRIHGAHERGERLPPGWITDAAGNPSTDPLDYMERRGRLLPLGGEEGHKGYGLIVLVDLLVGVLSGGGLSGTPSASPGGNAFLLIAIDVSRIVPPEQALAAFRALRDHVASAGAEVHLPGERSAEERARAESEGVTVDPPTWALLEALSAETGVPLPFTASASRR